MTSTKCTRTKVEVGWGWKTGGKVKVCRCIYALSTFNKSQENHVLGGTRGTKAIIEIKKGRLL